MPHHIELTKRVKMPADQIWEVLKDFDSIERTSHAVEKSPLLEGNESGVGTKRKCYFYDGTSVIEEITEYHEGESFKIVLSEFSMPLKSIEAQMMVKKVDNNICDISMSMDFVVKGGFIGKLLGFLILQHVLKAKVLKAELAGLAFHASTGIVIGKRLPSNVEFESIWE